MSNFEALFRFLSDVDRKVLDYLERSPSAPQLEPPHLQDSVWAYMRRPAKRLRPALVMLACGAVGGDPEIAVPAAAGVELFHTWTLVHDDIIDDDALRRGFPTVHVAAADRIQNDLGLNAEAARHYGRSVAILTGDAQYGWSIAAIAEAGLSGKVNPLVILRIIQVLQSQVVGQLVSGELLDVEYGLRRERAQTRPTEEQILKMLWLKTGVLCAFAGLAGAMIGKDCDNPKDSQAEAISEFAGKCGTAFQLQDDIIGIAGNEADTGKPVGSDIVEGKLTLIVLEALKNASEAQRSQLLSVLGNKQATKPQIERTTRLLRELGGIEYVNQKAQALVREALTQLETIPPSEPKQLLESLAEFMIDRRF